MAGLVINGSHVLGPSPSSGSLTLAAYLASIGKNSSWGLWEAGTNMAANSDGTGTVTTDVGKWSKSAGAGLSAEWIQPTSGQRMLYSASVQGSPAIYGESDTNSRGMYLDSNTPVSSNYTIVMRVNCIQETTSNMYSFSHNSAVNALTISNIGVVTARASSLTSSGGNQMSYHLQNFPSSATTSEMLIGMNCSSNNSPAWIGKRSTGTSPSGMGFRKILIVSGSQLTRAEMDYCAGILGA